MSRARVNPHDDPAYAALKGRVVARTGHHYYADKDDLLFDRLRRRFKACGLRDCAGYLARLDDREAGPAEWAALEAEITIGETFFFRYAEQFAALRETILPGLVADRAVERTLRVWSAGCSTGAEPYSLAILAHELLGPALPDWHVSILGTDISRDALATARAAEYGRWALRTLPPQERLRHFQVIPPRPGGALREGGYALRPEFRRMVRFERQNLLALLDGSGPVPPGEFDLILCRNVLIYFHADTVAGIVRALGRRLRPGGWLLIGHAEPNPAFSGWLSAVNLPGTVAYRRLEDGPPALQGAPLPAPRAGAILGVQPIARVPGPDVLAPNAFGPLPVSGGGPEGGLGDGVLLSETTSLAPAGADASPPGGSDPAPGRPSPAERPAPPETSPPASTPGSTHISTLSDGEAPLPVEEALARIRALSDGGETGQAWRELQAILLHTPTDPRLRFYEGLLARGLGREAEAERGLRAALYLDRDFVMAHYHLGLLLIALGRLAPARRALDNAVALAQALDPASVLPEADGACAGEIAESARIARAGIGRGAA
ncbi:CheR family methyltransferase [Methylobacterium sp. A54F]